MLSNRKLDVFTRLVPISILIFDEASQIEVGDYIPVFHRFQTALRKVVFIGDDKQLAPYGQDDIGDLRSIFEFPHIRRRACFLDTQYRMPVVIGQFISRQVYDGKLRTNHLITSGDACRFVDVQNGEEQGAGNSWQNREESAVVIHIARSYHKQGKLFRIVTPYDAQRNLIEKELQHAKLPWEDKCFNVDSFQGNEEDHIIISIVRSNQIGFLTN
ncbi:AAA domain-containing protein, partial [Hygrophoropsis aurantiaca]